MNDVIKLTRATFAYDIIWCVFFVITLTLLKKVPVIPIVGYPIAMLIGEGTATENGYDEIIWIVWMLTVLLNLLAENGMMRKANTPKLKIINIIGFALATLVFVVLYRLPLMFDGPYKLWMEIMLSLPYVVLFMCMYLYTNCRSKS